MTLSDDLEKRSAVALGEISSINAYLARSRPNGDVREESMLERRGFLQSSISDINAELAILNP